MIKQGVTIDSQNLNRSFLSKTATGTQIFLGNLNLQGGLQIGGLLNTKEIDAGSSEIRTTGRIYAGTLYGKFDGDGSSITNLSSSAMPDVLLLDGSRTMTGPLTISRNTDGTAVNINADGERDIDFRMGHSSYNYRFRFTGSESGNNNSLELWAYNNNNAVNQVFRVQQDGIFRLQQGANITGNVEVSGNTNIKGELTLTSTDKEWGLKADGENFSLYEADDNGKEYLRINDDASMILKPAGTAIATLDPTNGMKIEKKLEVVGEIYNGSANEFPDSLGYEDIDSWSSNSNGSISHSLTQLPNTINTYRSIRAQSSASNQNIAYEMLFSTAPSQDWTFSLYAMSTTSSKELEVWFRWYGADQSTLISSSLTTIPNTALSFTRYQISATAPNNASYFKVGFSNGTSGATIYAAGFQLEKGLAATPFKAYAGNNHVVMTQEGIYFPADGGVYSRYNNEEIVKDHSNGNITMNAAGNALLLGYKNTSYVQVNKEFRASGTLVIDTGARLYYQGSDTDDRYLFKAGDQLGGDLTIGNHYLRGATEHRYLRMSGENTTLASEYPVIIHADSNNNDNNQYLSLKSGSQELKITTGGAFTFNGSKVWTEGNDGAGSGLDADFIKGHDGLSWLSGNVLRVDTDGGYIEVGPKNPYYAHLSTDRQAFYFNRDIYVDGHEVWTEGNDGAGSGLDADTVDGLESGQFLRSDQSDTMDGDLTVTGDTSIDGNASIGGRFSFEYNSSQDALEIKVI